MIVRRAPGYPGRPPNPVRSPDPTAALVHLPAAIMKRGPAPRIIRLPKPSAVRVNPVASLAIGPPTSVDHHCSRLPAPADSCQIHPDTIGREIIVKVIHLRRRRAHINRRGSGLRLWRDFRLWWRRLGRGWIRLCLSAQRIVMAQHRGDHRGRQPKVLEIKHMIGRQIESRL